MTEMSDMEAGQTQPAPSQFSQGPGPEQYAPPPTPASQYAPPPPPASQYSAQPPPDTQYSAQPQQQYLPQPQAYGMPAPQTQPVVAARNPAISLLISFFVPGLGSMINGRVGIGVTILLVYILGYVLILFLIGIPIVIGAWIWGLVDAYQSAQKWNAAHGIIS
jgi:TM2 domain-containing membrane protein YozV